MIKAVIFDLDGVLTETSSYHFAAWNDLAATLNFQCEESFEPSLRGISRLDSLRLMLKTYRPDLVYTDEELKTWAAIKNDIYLARIKSMTPDDLFDGVLPLFDQLKADGVKIALASASLNGPLLLESLGIRSYFDHLVDPSMYPSKPHPGLFEDPLKVFDLRPDEAIGIEDAPAGIEAIKAAGLKAIGIGHPHDLKDADLIVSAFKDIPYPFQL